MPTRFADSRKTLRWSGMFCKQSFLEIKSKIKKLDKRFLNLIKELLIEKRYPVKGTRDSRLDGKIGDDPPL
jgi:hypothetical protein